MIRCQKDLRDKQQDEKGSWRLRPEYRGDPIPNRNRNEVEVLMERGEERFPRRRKAFRDDQKAVPLERKASPGDDEDRSREHRRSREDHEGCAPDPDRVRIRDPVASALQARQRAEDPGLELGQQLVGMTTCRRHAGSLAPSMWAGQPVATRQGLPRSSAVTRQSLTEPFPFALRVGACQVPVAEERAIETNTGPFMASTAPGRHRRRRGRPSSTARMASFLPRPPRRRSRPGRGPPARRRRRADRVVVGPDRGGEQLEPGVEEVAGRPAPPTRTTSAQVCGVNTRSPGRDVPATACARPHRGVGRAGPRDRSAGPPAATTAARPGSRGRTRSRGSRRWGSVAPSGRLRRPSEARAHRQRGRDDEGRREGPPRQATHGPHADRQHAGEPQPVRPAEGGAPADEHDQRADRRRGRTATPGTESGVVRCHSVTRSVIAGLAPIPAA